MDPQLIQYRRTDRDRLLLIGPKTLVRVFVLLSLTIAVVGGCQLVPNKPLAVFDLYRERMKSQDVAEARKLLSDQSQQLIREISTTYKMRQPPEDLALLNALDPVAAPVLMKAEATSALLQVRTLKGGLRLIHLTRKDPNTQWAIDLSEELRALESFLKARAALETLREQASEYAASWKAFTRQLDKMHVVEPPPPPEPTPPKPPPPKPKPKPKPKPTRPDAEKKK